MLWLASSAAPTADPTEKQSCLSHFYSGGTAMCRLTHAVFDNKSLLPAELHSGIRQWQQQAQASLRQLPAAAQQQLLGRLLFMGHSRCIEAAEMRLAWRATPSAVTVALQHHVQQVQVANVCDRWWLLKVLQFAAHTQSAQRLNGEQVASLMHAAVVNQQHKVLEILLCMPAARKLSTAQYSALLDAACARRDTHSLTELANKAQADNSLAGAAPEAVLRWLQAAVQQRNMDAINALLATDAAEQLEPAGMSCLFGQVVDQQHSTVAAVLLQHMADRHKQWQLQHPQQQQQSVWLDAGVVTGYCRVAIAVAKNCRSQLSACARAAVHGLLSAAQVFSLLCCAVTGKRLAWLAAELCTLDVAQQLQPDQAAELLLLALQSSETETARTLCEKLPAAENLASAANVQQLLQAGAEKRIFTPVEAAQRWGEPLRAQLQQLPWSVIEEATHHAILQARCISPGVRELVQLLDIVQHESKAQLTESAKQWGTAATAKLLATAVRLQDATASCLLCKHDAARRITAVSVSSLLQAVILQQQWQQSEHQMKQLKKRRKQQELQQHWQQEQLKALQAVLSLPAAAELIKSPELAQQVLQQAMKQQLPVPLMSLPVDKLRSLCACMQA
jgi:hypothetical protein